MKTTKMKEQAVSRIDWTRSGSSDAINGLKCEVELTANDKKRFSFWMRESYRIPAKVVESLNWDSA